MAHPIENSGLFDDEDESWQVVEQAAERFESAWRRCRRPDESVDLARYLPASSDAHWLDVLEELIKIDLEQHWKRKQPRRLEQYTARFAELASKRDVCVRLLCEEFVVRHRHGDRPRLAEYERRHPALYAAFREQIGPDVSQPPDGFDSRLSGMATRVQGARPEPAELGNEVLAANGYKLVSRLGTGNYGTVWRATAPGGVPVAVKIVQHEVEPDHARTERETLELVRASPHPGLIQLHAFWALPDRLILVIELASHTLRTCGPTLSIDKLLTYLQQAAEGLDYLHEQEILHRDVKPDNVLIVQDSAKLGDMGLVRLHHGERVAVNVTTSGTPHYLAPEAWRGQSVPQSDQYGLAVTYAELRLGRRIHEATDYVGLMHAHLHEQPRLDGLAPAERQVLRRALAKKPHHRYPTCSDFIDKLTHAVQTGTQPHRQRGWLWALALTALALIGSGVWWCVRG